MVYIIKASGIVETIVVLVIITIRVCDIVDVIDHVLITITFTVFTGVIRAVSMRVLPIVDGSLGLIIIQTSSQKLPSHLVSAMYPITY